MAKQLTREQVQSRKEKAERFLRNVLGDDERADEVAEESTEAYADRRHFEIINPTRSNTMPSNADLQKRIKELEEENQDLADQLDAIADIVGSDDEEEDEEEDDDAQD